MNKIFKAGLLVLKVISRFMLICIFIEKSSDRRKVQSHLKGIDRRRGERRRKKRSSIHVWYRTNKKGLKLHILIIILCILLVIAYNSRDVVFNVFIKEVDDLTWKIEELERNRNIERY